MNPKANIIRPWLQKACFAGLQPIGRSYRLNEVILFDSQVRSDLLLDLGGTGIYP
jgi:hypothetical protein